MDPGPHRVEKGRPSLQGPTRRGAVRRRRWHYPRISSAVVVGLSLLVRECCIARMVLYSVWWLCGRIHRVGRGPLRTRGATREQMGRGEGRRREMGCVVGADRWGVPSVCMCEMDAYMGRVRACVRAWLWPWWPLSRQCRVPPSLSARTRAGDKQDPAERCVRSVSQMACRCECELWGREIRRGRLVANTSGRRHRRPTAKANATREWSETR